MNTVSVDADSSSGWYISLALSSHGKAWPYMVKKDFGTTEN